jgi:hypothetical protein
VADFSSQIQKFLYSQKRVADFSSQKQWQILPLKNITGNAHLCTLKIGWQIFHLKNSGRVFISKTGDICLFDARLASTGFCPAGRFGWGEGHPA